MMQRRSSANAETATQRRAATSDRPGTGATPATPSRDPRALAGLLTADAISLTGNVVCLIALPLYVLATTGSVMKVGIISAAGTIPVVLGGALGGVIVDRAGYRRVSILSDIVGAVTMAAIPLTHTLGALPFWLLVLLVFATGLLDTPGQSARTALMPEAAARAGVPLERAMGWHGAVERGSRLVGAPLAGFLVAAFDALPVLALDAASFVLSALAIAGLVPRTLTPGTPSGALEQATTGAGSARGGASSPETRTGRLTAPDGEARPGRSAAPETAPYDGAYPGANRPAGAGQAGYWASLRGALVFLLRHPLLRAVVAMVFVTNALDAGKSQVIMPAYCTELMGGARALGLLVGAFGAGSLAGSLLFSAIGHRLSKRWTYAIGFMLCGGPVYFVFAANPGLGVCLVAMVVAGLASGSINPIIGTVMLTEVPPSQRASVSGLVGAGCWAAMPLGAIAAGALVEWRGLTAALVVFGALYLAATASPFFSKVWRRLDAPEAGQLAQR